MSTLRTLAVRIRWDDEGKVWWCESDDIPGLVTEGASFDALVERVLEIAPEIIQLNGVAPPGADVTIIVTAERGGQVRTAA